jgi:uncharacterized protein YbjQ (UPF0145 family)
MKFILYLGLIPFLFNACSYGSEVHKMVLVSGYDFTSYTERGFLFTSEQYLGDYDAVGLLNLEVIPEVRKLPYGTKSTEQGWETIIGNTRYWQVKEISSDEVLDSLYKKAISMGADAVVRFSLNANSHYNGDVTFYGLEASGFAIKRKGALK